MEEEKYTVIYVSKIFRDEAKKKAKEKGMTLKGYLEQLLKKDK